MASFTPVTSMQRLTLPDPIGVDQLKRRNALAEREQMVQEQNAAGYQQQLGMTQENMRRNWMAQDREMQAQQEAQQAAKQEQAVKDAYITSQYMARAKSPDEFRALAQRLGQNPVVAQHLQQQGASWEQITPDDVQELLSEFGAAAGIAPATPFEQTTDAQKLNLQHQQALELERQRARSAADLERLRQSAPDKGGSAGAPKALPVGALRLVDEAKQAINSSGQSLSLIDTALKAIDSGSVNLGFMNNAIARGRNLTGASSPESRAYADIKQTLEKLRNNYLLLAKGVQTEGDAQRAWNSEIGEGVQNDNALAKQQLNKARALIEQAVAMQNDRITTVYSNYGGQSPVATSAPAAGGWKIEKVQ